MKNSVLLLSSFTAISGLSVISCQTNTDKEKNVSQVVEEFDNSTGPDTRRFETDMQIFRQKMDKRIEANSQSLSEIRTRLKEENRNTNSDTSTTIFELELANGYMKIRLEKYEQHKKGDWDIFKRQFKRDMNDWNTEFTEFESNILKTIK